MKVALETEASRQSSVHRCKRCDPEDPEDEKDWISLLQSVGKMSRRRRQLFTNASSAFYTSHKHRNWNSVVSSRLAYKIQLWRTEFDEPMLALVRVLGGLCACQPFQKISINDANEGAWLLWALEGLSSFDSSGIRSGLMTTLLSTIDAALKLSARDVSGLLETVVPSVWKNWGDTTTSPSFTAFSNLASYSLSFEESWYSRCSSSMPTTNHGKKGMLRASSRGVLPHDDYGGFNSPVAVRRQNGNQGSNGARETDLNDTTQSVAVPGLLTLVLCRMLRIVRNIAQNSDSLRELVVVDRGRALELLLSILSHPGAEWMEPDAESIVQLCACQAFAQFLSVSCSSQARLSLLLGLKKSDMSGRSGTGPRSSWLQAAFRHILSAQLSPAVLLEVVSTLSTFMVCSAPLSYAVHWNFASVDGYRTLQAAILRICKLGDDHERIRSLLVVEMLACALRPEDYIHEDDPYGASPAAVSITDTRTQDDAMYPVRDPEDWLKDPKSLEMLLRMIGECDTSMRYVVREVVLSVDRLLREHNVLLSEKTIRFLDPFGVVFLRFDAMNAFEKQVVLSLLTSVLQAGYTLTEDEVRRYCTLLVRRPSTIILLTAHMNVMLRQKVVPAATLARVAATQLADYLTTPLRFPGLSALLQHDERKLALRMWHCTFIGSAAFRWNDNELFSEDVTDDEYLEWCGLASTMRDADNSAVKDAKADIDHVNAGEVVSETCSVTEEVKSAKPRAALFVGMSDNESMLVRRGLDIIGLLRPIPDGSETIRMIIGMARRVWALMLEFITVDPDGACKYLQSSGGMERLLHDTLRDPHVRRYALAVVLCVCVSDVRDITIVSSNVVSTVLHTLRFAAPLTSFETIQASLPIYVDVFGMLTLALNQSKMCRAEFIQGGVPWCCELLRSLCLPPFMDEETGGREVPVFDRPFRESDYFMKIRSSALTPTAIRILNSIIPLLNAAYRPQYGNVLDPTESAPRRYESWRSQNDTSKRSLWHTVDSSVEMQPTYDSEREELCDALLRASCIYSDADSVCDSLIKASLSNWMYSYKKTFESDKWVQDNSLSQALTVCSKWLHGWLHGSSPMLLTDLSKSISAQRTAWEDIVLDGVLLHSDFLCVAVRAITCGAASSMDRRVSALARVRDYILRSDLPCNLRNAADSALLDTVLTSWSPLPQCAKSHFSLFREGKVTNLDDDSVGPDIASRQFQNAESLSLKSWLDIWLDLVKELAKVNVTPTQLRYILSWLDPDRLAEAPRNIVKELLSVVESIARDSGPSPRPLSYGVLVAGSPSSIVWPRPGVEYHIDGARAHASALPTFANGYTLSLWMRIDVCTSFKNPTVDRTLEEELTLLDVRLGPMTDGREVGDIQMVYSTRSRALGLRVGGDSVLFSEVEIVDGEWTHICVIHSRLSKTVVLYKNGQRTSSGQLGCPNVSLVQPIMNHEWSEWRVRLSCRVWEGGHGSLNAGYVGAADPIINVRKVFHIAQIVLGDGVPQIQISDLAPLRLFLAGPNACEATISTSFVYKSGIVDWNSVQVPPGAQFDWDIVESRRSGDVTDISLKRSIANSATNLPPYASIPPISAGGRNSRSSMPILPTMTNIQSPMSPNGVVFSGGGGGGVRVLWFIDFSSWTVRGSAAVGLSPEDSRPHVILEASDAAKSRCAVRVRSCISFQTSLGWIGGVTQWIWLAYRLARTKGMKYELPWVGPIVIRLLAATLIWHPEHAREMEMKAGFALLSRVMRKSDWELNDELLDAVLVLTGITDWSKSLSDSKDRRRPSNAHMCAWRDLLLDWSLWIRAPVEIQRRLLSSIVDWCEEYPAGMAVRLRAAGARDSLLATMERRKDMLSSDVLVLMLKLLNAVCAETVFPLVGDELVEWSLFVSTTQHLNVRRARGSQKRRTMSSSTSASRSDSARISVDDSALRQSNSSMLDELNASVSDSGRLSDSMVGLSSLSLDVYSRQSSDMLTSSSLLEDSMFNADDSSLIGDSNDMSLRDSVLDTGHIVTSISDCNQVVPAEVVGPTRSFSDWAGENTSLADDSGAQSGLPRGSSGPLTASGSLISSSSSSPNSSAMNSRTASLSGMGAGNILAESSGLANSSASTSHISTVASASTNSDQRVSSDSQHSMARFAVANGHDSVQNYLPDDVLDESSPSLSAIRAGLIHLLRVRMTSHGEAMVHALLKTSSWGLVLAWIECGDVRVRDSVVLLIAAMVSLSKEASDSMLKIRGWSLLGELLRGYPIEFSTMGKLFFLWLGWRPRHVSGIEQLEPLSGLFWDSDIVDSSNSSVRILDPFADSEQWGVPPSEMDLSIARPPALRALLRVVGGSDECLQRVSLAAVLRVLESIRGTKLEVECVIENRIAKDIADLFISQLRRDLPEDMTGLEGTWGLWMWLIDVAVNLILPDDASGVSSRGWDIILDIYRSLESTTLDRRAVRVVHSRINAYVAAKWRRLSVDRQLPIGSALSLLLRLCEDESLRNSTPTSSNVPTPPTVNDEDAEIVDRWMTTMQWNDAKCRAEAWRDVWSVLEKQSISWSLDASLIPVSDKFAKHPFSTPVNSTTHAGSGSPIMNIWSANWTACLSAWRKYASMSRLQPFFAIEYQVAMKWNISAPSNRAVPLDLSVMCEDILSASLRSLWAAWANDDTSVRSPAYVCFVDAVCTSLRFASMMLILGVFGRDSCASLLLQASSLLLDEKDGDSSRSSRIAAAASELFCVGMQFPALKFFAASSASPVHSKNALVAMLHSLWVWRVLEGRGLHLTECPKGIPVGWIPHGEWSDRAARLLVLGHEPMLENLWMENQRHVEKLNVRLQSWIEARSLLVNLEADRRLKNGRHLASCRMTCTDHLLRAQQRGRKRALRRLWAAQARMQDLQGCWKRLVFHLGHVAAAWPISCVLQSELDPSEGLYRARSRMKPVWVFGDTVPQFSETAKYVGANKVARGYESVKRHLMSDMFSKSTLERNLFSLQNLISQGETIKMQCVVQYISPFTTRTGEFLVGTSMAFFADQQDDFGTTSTMTSAATPLLFETAMNASQTFAAIAQPQEASSSGTDTNRKPSLTLQKRPGRPGSDEPERASMRKSITILYADIRGLYKRRYLLRNTALEIFLASGRSCLLTCTSEKDRDALFDMLCSLPVSTKKQSSHPSSSKRNPSPVVSIFVKSALMAGGGYGTNGSMSSMQSSPSSPSSPSVGDITARSSVGSLRPDTSLFGTIRRTSMHRNLTESRTSSSGSLDAVKATAIDLTRNASALSSALFDSITDSNIAVSTLCDQWVRGEISNFEYIMLLNTLAGRSFNDLTQYPVFPVILSDFDSLKLDLNDKTAFRDLSKPMGAQTNARLQRFIEKYDALLDMNERPYYYGSHYSNIGSVLYFLVRVEPFSVGFIEFQGGRFDLPDRAFHSVGETWRLSSSDSASDVKELIPEFFTLSEMLVNANKFDFGVRHDKVRVNDVVLPPWADGDSRLFIRRHRNALESRLVSESLHLWIDLIFGFRQRGEAARAAYNVFHPLTYEGEVRIEDISDPVMRTATVAQISSYGQTPTQLFMRPHPSKSIVHSTDTSAVMEWTAWKVFQMESNDVLSLCSLALVGGSDPNATVLLPPLVTTPWVGSPTSLDGFYAADTTTGSLSSSDVRAVEATSWIHPSDSRYAMACSCGDSIALVVASGPWIVTGGRWGTIRVWRKDSDCVYWPLPGGSLLCGHTDEITWLVISTDWMVLYSGSLDGTVAIWDLNRARFIRRLEINSVPVAINSTPSFSSAEARRRRRVVSIAVRPLDGEVFVATAQELSLWTLNGRCVVRKTPSETLSDNSKLLRITSVAWFNAGANRGVVFCGLSSGDIVAWDDELLNPLGVFSAHESPVVSLLAVNDGLISVDMAGVGMIWSKAKMVNGVHVPFAALSFASGGPVWLAKSRIDPISVVTDFL